MDHFDSLDSPRGLGDKLKRYAKVSTSAIGVMARLMGEGYLGMNLDKTSHAENLKDSLGSLKGPMMKAAQLLATIPGALPDEYTNELMHLQSNAPPMGWLFVKRRMSQEMGKDWQSKFKSFEHQATAAASLGQVHKAVHKNGRKLACKLQYPDMKSTVHDDLQQLKLMLGIYGTVSKAIDTNNLYEELKERLNEELDYTLEAKHIDYYKKALETTEGVHLPEVLPELSTNRLLTMTWMEGQSVLNVKDLPLEKRNEIAQRMFRIWYQPLYGHGLIHGDPHLGNYTVRKDLSINLLDFGCIRKFPPSFIQGVIDLYKSLLHNDPELAVHAYESWGFTNLNKDVIEVLNLWAKFLCDPLLEDKIRTIHSHHGETYGREMASKVHAQLHKVGGVRPPREFVMMDRAAVGMGAVFMHLKAELNWHQEYEKLIEGFDVDAVSRRQEALV